MIYKHLSLLSGLAILGLTAAAPVSGPGVKPYEIVPKRETGPAGLDGDDPAIWIHKKDPARSVVITTSKEDEDGGLHVFGLQGKSLQFVPAGRPDNVDVIYDFEFDDDKIDLAVAACRTDDTLCMWKINKKSGLLEKIPGGSQKTPANFTVYGSCEYKSAKTGKQYVFINSKTSEYLQYEISEKDNKLQSKLVRRFMAGNGGQVEGCVADKDNGWLFIGEEDNGVWKYDAEPKAQPKGTLVDSVDVANGGHLYPDVEGMSLFYGKSKDDGYLIVSVQGINAYNIYERKAPHKYLSTFTLIPGNGIDEVTETDGLAVVSTGLNDEFPAGLLVVHDDHKTFANGTKAEQTTFKYVDFRDIARGSDQKLKLNPKWDPRQENDDEEDEEDE
ncbi:3-phytase [Powellomyces hirtus]|uniref:3-phytase n=1 Tax=Powellomyces hirtus TaxID=109895 RepID=A0A507DSA5_9FUNG|nr:3-phytase [Powellomyces hirtus]